MLQKKMEIGINNDNQRVNDDFNNLKNVISFILIIIISYLIETSRPNKVVRIIYILIIIFIIIGFIRKNLSQNHLNKIFSLFGKLFMKIKSNKINEKIKTKNLETIKDIYASGYSLNSHKKNNFHKNKNEPKSKISNKYQDLTNKNNKLEENNDGYLTNKITSINRINKCSPSLMDSFKNNCKEGKDDKKDMLTKLPSPDSKYGSIIVNPFQSISSQNISYKSSENQFFLLSSNKTENKNANNNVCNNNNPINILMNNENYQNINNSYFLMNKISKNKKVSYYKYLNLKSRNNNTQALNSNNNALKYNIDKIPRELISINYQNWIFKMKNFISKILIPNLINKHDNNIFNLNSCLSNLGLKIINTLPENESNDYMDTLNEKMFFVNSNKINNIIDNNNILFQNLKKQYDKYNNFNYNLNNNIENIFPSLNTFNSFLNEGKKINDKSSNESQLRSVFFGDTNKIKQILYIIENKINSLQNNNEYKNNKYQQRQLIIKIINSYDNPFLKKDISKSVDINKEVNDITLTRLQRLLYERIIINERLFPKELFEKKDEIHALLVMEYSIERFRQLQHNFDLYESGSKGGDFMNENWCSILPTDSQLIAHVVMSYIESIYSINNIISQQIFLLSYPCSYNISIDENDLKNGNQTSIFLYQINPPETEPKFNVAYKGNLIPCLLDNNNLFHSLCIYFFLLGVKSPMFVMNMGIHDFVNYITK